MRPRVVRRSALCAAALATFAGGFVGSAVARTNTLTVTINSTSYQRKDMTLYVTAHAFYNDPRCASSAACDRNVLGLFQVLRTGSGAYASVIDMRQAETGQGFSALAVWLNVPCNTIPSGTRGSYQVNLEAIAPDGEDQSTTRTVSIASCRTAAKKPKPASVRPSPLQWTPGHANAMVLWRDPQLLRGATTTIVQATCSGLPPATSVNHQLRYRNFHCVLLLRTDDPIHPQVRMAIWIRSVSANDFCWSYTGISAISSSCK